MEQSHIPLRSSQGSGYHFVYQVCAIVITLCVVVALILTWLYQSPSELVEGYLSGCHEPESIVVIPLHGDIAWPRTDEAGISGYEVTGIIEEIAYWGNFAGVIFDVDSGGGYPVASYRIAKAINSLNVPTAAVVGDLGLSGGYAIASAADRVFVDAASDVGSIGVTGSYVSDYVANEESGLIYESFSSGAYKDVGDPSRPLSDEERAYMQRNIDESHKHFVKLVSQNRDLPLEQVQSLADGKWFLGEEAIALGLADGIGALDEAVAYLRDYNGVDSPVCYAAL